MSSSYLQNYLRWHPRLPPIQACLPRSRILSRRWEGTCQVFLEHRCAEVEPWTRRRLPHGPSAWSSLAGRDTAFRGGSLSDSCRHRRMLWWHFHLHQPRPCLYLHPEAILVNAQSRSDLPSVRGHTNITYCTQWCHKDFVNLHNIVNETV